jgi:hypothetical protein
MGAPWQFRLIMITFCPPIVTSNKKRYLWRNSGNTQLLAPLALTWYNSASVTVALRLRKQLWFRSNRHQLITFPAMPAISVKCPLAYSVEKWWSLHRLLLHQTLQVFVKADQCHGYLYHHGVSLEHYREQHRNRSLGIAVHGQLRGRYLHRFCEIDGCPTDLGSITVSGSSNLREGS